MMKSPACHMLSKASWLITALASIHQGLMLFEWYLIKQLQLAEYVASSQVGPYIMTAIYVLIGLSGIISLVAFFTCRASCSN